MYAVGMSTLLPLTTKDNCLVGVETSMANSAPRTTKVKSALYQSEQKPVYFIYYYIVITTMYYFKSGFGHIILAVLPRIADSG